MNADKKIAPTPVLVVYLMIYYEIIYNRVQRQKYQVFFVNQNIFSKYFVVQQKNSYEVYSLYKMVIRLPAIRFLKYWKIEESSTVLFI